MNIQRHVIFTHFHKKTCMQYIQQLLVLLFCFSFLYGQANAICNPDIDATTPTSRFTFVGNGVVVDKRTNLMWSRCLGGYSLNQNSTPSNFTDDICDLTGDRGKSWQLALQAADVVTLAGFSDWRLPNIKELSSIVERKCINPSINMIVFPGIDSGNRTWTSSGGRWLYWFNTGIVANLGSPGASNFFRFVRSN